jgi:NitT/TauT family transport system ATP-binding protein
MRVPAEGAPRSRSCAQASRAGESRDPGSYGTEEAAPGARVCASLALRVRFTRPGHTVLMCASTLGGAYAAEASKQAPCICLDEVGLRYQAGRGEVEALSGITLTVGEGEFVAVVGPTGCGKSSLLRLVSDLLAPTSGAITVRGEPSFAARRTNQFGFVFQEPALLSWRSTIANVHLPLEVVGYPPQRRKERCEELLASVGLLAFAHAYPHELSGGMKQRVAIVRALAWNPSILLMDEPFSALDELTRSQLQDDLLALWSRERKTVLFVTHNISEAIYLADRVVVMSGRPGRIKTILSPELPRPRSLEMQETTEFMQWIRQAREALRV